MSETTLTNLLEYLYGTLTKGGGPVLRENKSAKPQNISTRSSASEYSIVVSHLNKMVYRIMDDYIEVADFWDTRREPQRQAEQVKGLLTHKTNCTNQKENNTK